MININRNGSVILILPIILSVILLYYITAWHSVTLMSDLALKRYGYQKRVRIAEMLYNYGLALCINNYNLYIKQNTNTINLYNGPWPVSDNKYIGSLRAHFKDQSIHIEAKIIEQSNKETYNVSAYLAKQQDKFVISNWQINAN